MDPARALRYSLGTVSTLWPRTSGRASTTVSRAGRILKEKKDVERAEEKLQALNEQVAELESLMTQDIEELKASLDPLTEELEALTVSPKKSGISISLVTLAWAPYWQEDGGALTPAW